MYIITFVGCCGEFVRTKHQTAQGAYSFWRYMRRFAQVNGWQRVYIQKIAQS